MYKILKSNKITIYKNLFSSLLKTLLNVLKSFFLASSYTIHAFQCNLYMLTAITILIFKLSLSIATFILYMNDNPPSIKRNKLLNHCVKFCWAINNSSYSRKFDRILKWRLNLIKNVICEIFFYFAYQFIYLHLHLNEITSVN